MTDTAARRGGEPMQICGGVLGDLQFTWQDDRYQHAWTFGPEGSLGLTSLESPASTTWPISPPLQQIHQQSFADGREVIFGVGMSGRGHWSASFTLVPDLKCWIVELACRSSIAAQSLMSSYQQVGPWQPEGTTKVTASSEATQLSLEALSPAALSIQDACISVAPTTSPTAGSTLQWAFRLRIM